MKRNKTAALFLICLVALAALAATAQRNRVPARVDTSRRAPLRGNVHPMAIPANDQGPADPDLLLPRLSVVLQPSEAQQADLDRFLAEQQDPASPNYHRWLTPEEYADRFGVTRDDINKIVGWLQSQNFTAVTASHARNT